MARYLIEIDPESVGDGLRRLCDSLRSAESDVAVMAAARRRIKNIPNPTERARVGVMVFGRSWVEVVYGDS